MHRVRLFLIQTLLFCLVLTLLLPSVANAQEPVITEEAPLYDTVKVGLYYGSTVLTEARLENEVGSGYLFGWYDDDRIFHEVARTDVTRLTMTGDLNLTTENNVELGCYHLLVSGPYTEYDAALQAISAEGFIAYYSGEYFVMNGQYQSVAEAEKAVAGGAEGTVYTASNRCIVVTETGTNRILFEFDCGAARSLAIRPISEGEKSVTWFKQLMYYGDFQYSRLTGDEGLTVVNYVGLEDYTKGVVPYEMSASWPLEALKAQALCARNFVATSFDRYRAHGFDVTADTYSQVYRGISSYDSINQAVDETAGQFIRYNGEICQTYFFSSDGGATESAAYVWTNGVPYLMGVEDPYEEDVNTGSKDWTYSLSPEELTEQLNERMGCRLGTIVSVRCEYTDMNNVKSITFTDEFDDSFTVNNNRCVYAIGSQSPRFQVTTDAQGNFEVKGSGWGHNCGMSQYGAYSMARYHVKTAEEIIKFYYTGVYIS